MFQFLESYDNNSGRAVTVGGRTYPDLALIEDPTGVKFLAMAEPMPIPVHAWVQAHSAGVSMLALAHQGGWWLLSTEAFMTHREEDVANRAYMPPQDGWVYATEPTYDAFHAARQAPTAEPEPVEPDRFVALHAHSEYSALDGMSKVKEMVDSAAKFGQPALALTDHGVCAGHPELQRLCDDAEIKPIFGLEAYFVDDRRARPLLPDSPTPDMVIGIAEQMGLKDPFRIEKLAEEEAQRLGKTKPKKVAEAEEIKLKVLGEYKMRKAEEVARIGDYYHLVLWAMNDMGLQNLWALTTLGNYDGFYKKPRLDWDALIEYNAGLMCSTACLRGPVIKPVREFGNVQHGVENLGRLMGIFPNRLFTELHTNHVGVEPGKGYANPHEGFMRISQRDSNLWLAELANTNGIPLIVVNDSHYPCADDGHAHEVWMAVQTNSDIQDDTGMFQGEADYYLHSREESARSLDYIEPHTLEQALDNTVLVAEMCNARVQGKTAPPIFSKKATTASVVARFSDPASEEARIAEDVARLVDTCVQYWDKTLGKEKDQETYVERFEYEMDLLVDKNFCGYFMMWADICGHAKANGILVGPGRGSGGGCLVAYLCGITELDPVENDLMFERFLTRGRQGLPDFDVDFPQSKRDFMTDYVINKYGGDHVVRVGTHTRAKNKGIIRSLATALKSVIDIHWPDIDAVSKIIDRAEASTAGKGLSWEELWDQHGDELGKYSDKYPELFRMAEKLVGRVKSYGKHAAGVCISADTPIADRLPARYEEETGRFIAEFAMDDLEALGYVKFDMLTIRNLDTIQECVDLIRDQVGDEINVYAWKEEYNDQDVWASIGAGRTLGLFQVETASGTRLCRRFKPTSMNQMSDVITLVRPGPMRSGLTETYFQRKTGAQPVTYAHPLLEPLLNKTFGCMLYQEDIMAVCRALAGYTLEEADGVRKMLGKKKTELAQGAADEFVGRAAEYGVCPAEVARMLGDQMIEFSKYSFNRSHAFAYAMIGYWTAWLKYHYPIQFLTAALSTVDKNRIPEFIQEARRLGISILPPDVNKSGAGFSGDPEALTIRYGLDAISGIGEAAMSAVKEGQPYTSFDDFVERRGAKADKGVIRKLAAVGVFDSIEPHRAGLLARLAFEEQRDTQGSQLCQWHSDQGQPVTFTKRDGTVEDWWLPCGYPWADEPVEVGKTGRPKKAKPPVKKCTRGCRQFVAPSEPDYSAVPPLTPEEIQEVEFEVLGTWISSTPFDRIREVLGEQFDEEFRTAEEIEDAPVGHHMFVGLITGVKHTQDRRGRDMCFLTVNVQNGDLSITVFSSIFRKFKDDLVVGRLLLGTLNKQSEDDQRFLLAQCEPV